MIKLLLAAILLLSVVTGQAAVQADAQQQCQLRALSHADAGLTLSEVRRRCEENADAFQPSSQQPGAEQSAADEAVPNIPERRSLELSAATNPYGITPHRVNYLLPVTYNSRPNRAPFGEEGAEFDKAETKFQFSYKVPIFTQIQGQAIDLFFAYTNQSWWQSFNGRISRPFRETNHEPELFFTWTDPPAPQWIPRWVDHVQLAAGLSHQSNGRSGELSRSWDRLYVRGQLEKNNLFVGLKVWDRLPRDSKKHADDPRGDDNPDIERFMGHFELDLVYKRNKQSLGLLIRNNLRRDDNFGALQLDYSFPITAVIQGYMQYFDGYGESLVDYNHNSQRFGLGIAINE